MLRGLLVTLFLFLSSLKAHAQDTSWIQLQALPTLNAAQEAARGFSTQLENVNGFYLGSNWYGIALGPYTRDDANTLRRQLRAQRIIPRDAFVTDGERFGQQFWPIGVGAETTPQPIEQPLTETADAAVEAEAEAPVVAEVETPAEPEPQPAPEPEPEPIPEPDETVTEARRSEALLTRAEREELQIMLKWAGYYNAAIDGAFGRGTRASMRAWQQDQGTPEIEPTGVLTTAQRALLKQQYNAILEGVDLELIEDTTAGIAVKVPTGLVEFDAYDSPFARYSEKDGSGIEFLLISQEGDRTRMNGLYEILQTLEIVPLEGPRSRNNSSFVIEGINDERHTYITASVRDGAIKGYGLIWPTGDEERRTRVLNEIEASFARLDGVLDPAAVPAEDAQAIDLVSGLAIRKPKFARAGFYVDANGAVLTAAANVENCERITLDDSFVADVVYEDAQLAVLKPQSSLAPMGVADIQTVVPRINSDASVAGYPFGGVLNLPTLTLGTLADVRGLDGDETVQRLAMPTTEGNIGGPVFDAGGAVMGVMLPTPQIGGQILPDDVSFAATSAGILTALSEAGIAPRETDVVAYMPPETLTNMAGTMSVLVSCW